jgi:hypothetical protein
MRWSVTRSGLNKGGTENPLLATTLGAGGMRDELKQIMRAAGNR